MGTNPVMLFRLTLQRYYMKLSKLVSVTKKILKILYFC